MTTAVCKKCRAEHDNPARLYCAVCSGEILRQFALAHEIRTNLHGSPDRPTVRKEMHRD